MRQRIKLVILLLSIVSIMGCAAYHLLAPEATPSPLHGSALTFERFGELWDIIVEKHPGALPDTPEERLACFQKMLAGGLESCLHDRFSHYLSKEKYAEEYDEMRGSYGGIGLVLSSTNAPVTVTAIIEGSPAQKSGAFLVGDAIIEVKGKDVSQKSTEAVIAEIRGHEDTEITVRAARNGKKLDPVTLVRARISMPSVHAMDIGDDITYIRIDYFNFQTPGEFFNAIASRLLVAQSDDIAIFDLDVKKFIFDIRGNPGGSLAAVGMMCYLFAKDNDHIVITEQSRAGEEIVRARDFVKNTAILPAGIFKGITMALLIDGTSASSAEIFAAFVHEATGAARIGKKSYGKGSLQQIFPLEEEDALYLTVAEYFVGNQKIRINKIGIQPEYEVDNPVYDNGNDGSVEIRVNSAKDLQFKKAIDLLRAPRT